MYGMSNSAMACTLLIGSFALTCVILFSDDPGRPLPKLDLIGVVDCTLMADSIESDTKILTNKSERNDIAVLQEKLKYYLKECSKVSATPEATKTVCSKIPTNKWCLEHTEFWSTAS